MSGEVTAPMNDWSAARHELLKGRVAAWQAYDRMLNSERTAIRRAMRAHIRQRERLETKTWENPHPEPLDTLGWLNVMGDLAKALQAVEQQMDAHAALLAAPCHDPLLLLSATNPSLLASESRVKKQARDRRYLEHKRKQLTE